MRSALFVVLFCMISDSAFTDDRASEIEALKLISNTADQICNENLAQRSNRDEISIQGSARAEIDGLAKKLLDLGIEGAGSYKGVETEGVVQRDLASAIRSQAGCKQGVFYALLERFIPGEKNVNPFVAESDNLQIPEPLSSVRSGQRFAMKQDEARLVAGSNFMITLTSFSGNDPPLISIRYTDLTEGTGGKLNPRLGQSASFGNCILTYYAASKSEGTASFYLSCS